MCSLLSSMPIELTGSHSCRYLDAGVFIFYFIYSSMPIEFEKMVNVFFHGHRSTQRALGTLHWRWDFALYTGKSKSHVKYILLASQSLCWDLLRLGGTLDPE